MKFVKILFLFSFLFLSACGGSSTSRVTEMNGSWTGSKADGTLHALIVVDTDDRSVGESVKIDLQNMQNLMRDISQYTEMRENTQQISGNDVTRGNVNSAINNLSVGSNDVVFFYYSGHGFNPGRSKWPAMSLNDGSLTLKEVKATLKRKKPRLLIVMADTCNSFTGGRFPPLGSARGSDNYKELFLKYQGVITASSSKPGQYSWGNERIGGLYTYQFLGSLNQELSSTQRPSWDALMSRANKFIQAGGSSQQPQSKVEVAYIGVGIGGGNSFVFDDPCERTPQAPGCNPISSPGLEATGTCVGSYYTNSSGEECCRDQQGIERCWDD